jgi:hypothetical protein
MGLFSGFYSGVTTILSLPERSLSFYFFTQANKNQVAEFKL